MDDTEKDFEYDDYDDDIDDGEPINLDHYNNDYVVILIKPKKVNHVLQDAVRLALIE